LLRKLVLLVGVVSLAALPALAGEWHAGNNNVCTDCHTMHFSMQHNWDGTTPVPTAGGANGNWLGASGPNQYLLKAPANQLCLSCHSRINNPPTIGSQPPSFHDLTLPRYRNCTTCHVAVHGSNLSTAFLK